MGIPELLLRITIGFLVLFFLTRILGRKEISQLSFVNFVSGIAIGSIAANFVVNQDIPILHGVIALTGWTVFTFAMAFIDIWTIKGRKIVSGDPVIVIKAGKIVDKALSRHQLNLDALMAMLREKNIFSIAEVDYAIFETNGKLSILLKQGKQPVTKMDMNIQGKSRVYPIPTEIIVDGKVIPENLKKMNLDNKWVNKQLRNQDIESVSDVFFAQVQTDGSLFIDKKEESWGSAP